MTRSEEMYLECLYLAACVKFLQADFRGSFELCCFLEESVHETSLLAKLSILKAICLFYNKDFEKLISFLETALIFSEENNTVLAEALTTQGLAALFNPDNKFSIELTNQSSLQIFLILAEVYFQTKKDQKLARCLDTYVRNSKKLDSTKYAQHFVLVNTDLSLTSNDNSEIIPLIQKFFENNEIESHVNDLVQKSYVKALFRSDRFYELSIHEKVLEHRFLEKRGEETKFIEASDANEADKNPGFQVYSEQKKFESGKVLIDLDDLEIRDRFDINSSRMDPTFGKEALIRRVLRLSFFY